MTPEESRYYNKISLNEYDPIGVEQNAHNKHFYGYIIHPDLRHELIHDSEGVACLYSKQLRTNETKTLD
jgi:hypothetical protein